MHEGHEGHDDHPLPPPEPDNIAYGSVLFWGFGTFALVVVTVFALSGHFWNEMRAEEVAKMEQAAQKPAVLKQQAIDKQRLENYRKLENGKVQVPVNRAMDLMVKERG